MKKCLFLLTISLILTACGTYRSLNLNDLRTGMTTAEVEYIAGSPYKILANSSTPNGNQVVLAYRTNNDDYYALEFWNDYLVGYEYLYSDYPTYYSPSPMPPAYIPPVGQPIIIINNPPYRPGYNHRPSYNGGNGGYTRPNNSRPSTGNSGRYSSGRYSSGSSNSTTSSSSSSSGRYDSTVNSSSTNTTTSGRYNSGSNTNSSNSGRSSGRISDSSSNSGNSSSSSSSGRTSGSSYNSSSSSSRSSSTSSSGRSSSSSSSGRTSSGRSSGR